MSKYAVGDKFVIEIKGVAKDGTYKVQEGHYFAESIFNSMHKIDSNMKIEDITDMIAEYETEKKGYNKGLADAWELARKLTLNAEDDFSCDQVEEIFGRDCFCVLGELTPQQALAKIEAYEKSQQIEIGDIVRRISDNEKYLIITEEEDDSVYKYGVIDLKSMTIDRITGDLSKFKKTGRHIYISSILEQIRGNE